MSTGARLSSPWHVSLLAALALFAAGHSFAAPPATATAPATAPLETVPSVDINRYMGRWYQIAYLSSPGWL